MSNVVLLSPEERREVVLTKFERADSVVQRIIYAVVGVIFLAIGIAGYVIPGLPGTVFLLMALWFFGQSNERMFRWMLSNRFFGRQLVNYKAGLGVPRIIKFVAISCIVGFSAWSLFSLSRWWLQGALVFIALWGVGFILTRPTREKVVARLASQVPS